jgi:hypothetical protein
VCLKIGSVDVSRFGLCSCRYHVFRRRLDSNECNIRYQSSMNCQEPRKRAQEEICIVLYLGFGAGSSSQNGYGCRREKGFEWVNSSFWGELHQMVMRNSTFEACKKRKLINCTILSDVAAFMDCCGAATS